MSGFTREAHLQRRIREYYTQRGYLVIKLTTLGRYGHRGWPDLLVLGPEGKCFFIEVKTPRGRVSKLQQKQIEQLLSLDHDVRIVRSVEDLPQW